MKTNNTLKIQVANYEGVTVEIDTAKVSKETQDYFTKELQTERFKIWETLDRQSYFAGGFQIVTAPLEKTGYRAITENDKLIFVNSKLPKAERKEVIKRLTKKRETYLDILMKNCQFQEFRWKREFTEFCISKFVPKLESKCLEIKNKYDFNGQSLTLEKWLDICIAENVFPLTDEEAGEVAETTNGFHATYDNGTKAIWVRGTLSLEEALPVAAHELAHHILNHSGLPFDKDIEQTGSVEDYLDYPEHLRNEIEADVLGAMLLAETI